jgi:hypothetical protein
MTKDDILSMARDCGMETHLDVKHKLERFAALVAEKEREECAKVLEAHPSYDWNKSVCEAVAAIRARGQKEYRGARLVLTKDGVKQDGWMGDK